jgi:hypothetical protein
VGGGWGVGVGRLACDARVTHGGFVSTAAGAPSFTAGCLRPCCPAGEADMRTPSAKREPPCSAAWPGLCCRSTFSSMHQAAALPRPFIGPPRHTATLQEAVPSMRLCMLHAARFAAGQAITRSHHHPPAWKERSNGHKGVHAAGPAADVPLEVTIEALWRFGAQHLPRAQVPAQGEGGVKSMSCRGATEPQRRAAGGCSRLQRPAGGNIKVERAW